MDIHVYFVIVISIFRWIFRHMLSLYLLTKVENIIFLYFQEKTTFQKKGRKNEFTSLNINGSFSFLSQYFCSSFLRSYLHEIEEKIASYRHPRFEIRPIFLLHRNAHHRLVQILDKMHELTPSLAHQNRIHRHDVS